MSNCSPRVENPLPFQAIQSEDEITVERTSVRRPWMSSDPRREATVAYFRTTMRRMSRPAPERISYT